MSSHGDELVPLPDDTEQQQMGFGRGGVPLLLLLFYLGFLAFFTWYALEYQLPDFLEEGPGQTAVEAPAGE